MSMGGSLLEWWPTPPPANRSAVAAPALPLPPPPSYNMSVMAAPSPRPSPPLTSQLYPPSALSPPFPHLLQASSV